MAVGVVLLLGESINVVRVYFGEAPSIHPTALTSALTTLPLQLRTYMQGASRRSSNRTLWVCRRMLLAEPVLVAPPARKLVSGRSTVPG